MFQFLIGTFKTDSADDQDKKEFIVSIPHRYVQNARTVFNSDNTAVVSIPHRYVQNKCLAGDLGRASVFQFLIGTFKTCPA